MVLNLSDVKHAIRSQVTEQLDFRCLNTTWPEFDVEGSQQAALPTTEWLLHAIWQRLSGHLPLRSLRLFEQSTLWADYLGNDMEAFLTIRGHFAAAHRLAREELSQSENDTIYGKCARPHGHGHNYTARCDRARPDRSPQRHGLRSAALQKLLDDEVLEPFDHTFLNKDVPFFSTCVPTAENIALHIADRLKAPMPISVPHSQDPPAGEPQQRC